MDILNMILKNEKIAYLGRCIKHVNDARFRKEVFDLGRDGLTICFKSYGGQNPEKRIYVIQFDDRYGIGMCALIRFTLEKLNYADYFGFTPVVQWGTGTLYSEPEDEERTQDAFSKYFMPIGAEYALQLSESYMVAYSHISDRLTGGVYTIDGNELDMLSRVYKKYFALNTELSTYVDSEVSKLGESKKVIGVHVRGTDYNKHFKNHPVVVTKEEYLAETRKLLESGKYDKVFLATDERAVVELFERELGDRVVFYKDVYRSDGTQSVHGSNDSRERHRYKLGLEVLRDVYTLARCDALVAGLSNVPLLARVVNGASEKNYEDVVIIDHGTYTMGANCSKERISK